MCKSNPTAVAMVAPILHVVFCSTILVFTSYPPALALAESKADFAAVESFIDEEKPTLLSQALYVAVPKDIRDPYQEEVIQHPIAAATTVHPMTALFEQRIREIFSRTEPKPVMSNADEPQVFKVQRTPDGKLSVIFNNTQITPQFTAGMENDQDNGGPVNVNRHSQTVRDIVFPTDAILTGIQPKCAQNSKNFCTEVENYPTALLESILMAESKKYEQLFGDDMVIQAPINLTQRIDVPGEESLCQCLERLIYPQAGINKDNNWSIIVNQQNFTQGIRVEECISPGSPCAMSESFPIGYKTECRQKYIYRQLLSLNSEGHITKDLFKLPSCCKCIVTSSHRFRREIIHKKAPNRK